MSSNRVKTVERTWAEIVAALDPERAAEIKKEIEYDFRNLGQGRGRLFTADPTKRGAYAEDE